MEKCHFTLSSKGLDKDKIIVLLDGWRYNRYFYHIIKLFIPREYGYLHYSYSGDLLNSNPGETKQNILQLVEIVSKDINSLISQKPRSVYLYGQSLGGLFCMIISDKITIQKSLLIVPGFNLAESFWMGEHTEKLKNKMVKGHNITLPELKELWREVSPYYYFKDKSLSSDFSIVLSTKDKAIPISDGRKLIEILKSKNITLDLWWSKISHRKTLIKELIFAQHFSRWVKSFI